MPSARTVFVAMSFAAALIVAVLGYGHLRTLLRALDSPDWPQVTGSVRSAEVRRGCGRQRDSFEVDIRYDYSVRGLEYRSARVEFGRGYCGNEAGALAISKAYSPGAAVTVYVDPTDPARSVLLAGKVDMLMVLAVAIAALTVIGMLVLPWRMWSGRLRVSW